MGRLHSFYTDLRAPGRDVWEALREKSTTRIRITSRETIYVFEMNITLEIHSPRIDQLYGRAVIVTLGWIEGRGVVC